MFKPLVSCFTIREISIIQLQGMCLSIWSCTRRCGSKELSKQLLESSKFI